MQKSASFAIYTIPKNGYFFRGKVIIPAERSRPKQPSRASQSPLQRGLSPALSHRGAQDFRGKAATADFKVTLPRLEFFLFGNSHFMFQEMNNAEIADLLFKWLKTKGL